MNEHLLCLAVIFLAVAAVVIPCLLAWVVEKRLANPFVGAERELKTNSRTVRQVAVKDPPTLRIKHLREFNNHCDDAPAKLSTLNPKLMA